MFFLFMFHVSCLHILTQPSQQSEIREAGPFVANQTGSGDHFRLPSGPLDRFWLPNLVLLGPVLARWVGNQQWSGGTNFGSQNRSGGQLLGRTNFRVTGQIRENRENFTTRNFLGSADIPCSGMGSACKCSPHAGLSARLYLQSAATLAPSPGHSQILSRSRGGCEINLGVAWGRGYCNASPHLRQRRHTNNLYDRFA